ncbi:ECF transporter S component [Caproiciproducens galactitolivorans]|uniref:ECF transporter S component n=1 Tax=Caproiciproducens galactitolivorans TaxID=642589 RepID=A0A4Z0Y9X2_9FIRM|nr:ECF transporter S component [Caproiciproducens galactitolivorans]QEY35816.1 ECF transporter S component [Caproiciproducens galactitolivorans]TGJ75760.1 hypothetical protein CAGA_21380 [Caproiciproducens galactitolivorans]
MNMLKNKKTTVSIALTGLMGALVLVGTYMNIPIPVLGDRTMLSLGNVFCILSGLVLGPLYGGLAAGVGSFIFDITGGWASSAPFTLVFKFIMAFVCGTIANGGKQAKKKLSRLIIAAVSGSLTYSILYLTKSYIEAVLLGNSAQAIQMLLITKGCASLTNAIIADCVAVPLFLAISKALFDYKITGRLRQ